MNIEQFGQISFVIATVLVSFYTITVFILLIRDQRRINQLWKRTMQTNAEIDEALESLQTHKGRPKGSKNKPKRGRPRKK